MIIFCDGLDVSSKHSKEDAIKVLQSFENIRVICVGLAVDEETEDMLVEIASQSKRGVFVSSEDIKLGRLYSTI